MSLQPIPGFKHFPTHHCVTGSMQHIYTFHNFPLSEEMLLGLGSGVGFIYWHMKNSLPFLGGRANTNRPGEEGLEIAAGRLTGVKVDYYRTESAAKAERTLLRSLEAGEPVMLILDMGFLPYFDFGGEEFHFGYHVVVACGYDPDTRQVLVADRDEPLHPVSLDDLAKARGSKYKPFPPHNAWFSFDFSAWHAPEAADILKAIHLCAEGMLVPPIANLGVKGIRKAARRIQKWPQILDDKDLRSTCLNTAIMIDARGGTGGGLFRFMYGRFLEEAVDLTGVPELSEAAERMHGIGEQWEAAAQLFEQAYTVQNPEKELGKICTLLPQIAEQEEAAWEKLLSLTETKTVVLAGSHHP